MVFSVACFAQVQIKQSPDRVSVSIDGKPFTDFFVGADAVKPYLHPLRTASGKVVTRSYPMETVEGEAKDHPHHRGLWITHGLLNEVDFWANEKNQKGRGRPAAGRLSRGGLPRWRAGRRRVLSGPILSGRILRGRDSLPRRG